MSEKPKFTSFSAIQVKNRRQQISKVKGKGLLQQAGVAQGVPGRL